MSESLEQLYKQAQSALKARDYVRASELLRQILQIDENYKDTSRLLAQMVKLRRRRWYNHPLLWSTIGIAVIVTLGVWLAPRISLPAPSVEEATAQPTASTIPNTATSSPSPTPTLMPTATALPLTWKRISLGQEFPRDSVTAFATDKNDPDVIYASMENAGVYKTIDGGLSWRPAHQGIANTQVESLLIDSQNPHILYAGTMAGVFKTDDGGENWYRIGDGTYLLMDYQDSSHLYAHDDNSIYETTDRGNNWITTHSLNKECPSTIHAWAIHPQDGKTLFVGGRNECGPGVYQSDNSGRTWTLLEMKNSQGIIALAIGLDYQGAFSIYVQSHGWGENYGLYVSHNGGENWSKISHSGCNFFFIDPDNPSHIFCGSGGSGIFTIQGKGSPIRGIGLRTITPTAIYVDHYKGVERILVGGTRHSTPFEDGIFISTDGGTSWENHNGGLGSTRAQLKLDPITSARMYLATYFRSTYYRDNYYPYGCILYRTLDRGETWSEISYDYCGYGLTFDEAGALHLPNVFSLDGGDNWWPMNSRMAIDSTNPFIDGLVYFLEGEISYSADGGKSWLPASGGEDLWDARLFFEDQGQTVYAIGRYHQAYSTDDGRTWQNCGEDVTASRSDSRLALDLQGSRLYLATPGQGVLVSDDNCGSWLPSNNGLSNLFVNTLALDPNNPDIVYAGTDGGAYISFDGGQTWGQVNEGLLGATVVYSIAVDKDSNVYAATPYGIFKLEGK